MAQVYIRLQLLDENQNQVGGVWKVYSGSKEEARKQAQALLDGRIKVMIFEQQDVELSLTTETK